MYSYTRSKPPYPSPSDLNETSEPGAMSGFFLGGYMPKVPESEWWQEVEQEFKRVGVCVECGQVLEFLIEDKDKKIYVCINKLCDYITRIKND
jgi:hypothetical protein